MQRKQAWGALFMLLSFVVVGVLMLTIDAIGSAVRVTGMLLMKTGALVAGAGMIKRLNR